MKLRALLGALTLSAMTAGAANAVEIEVQYPYAHLFNTTYEFRLTLHDPDGGDDQQVVQVTTRSKPQVYEHKVRIPASRTSPTRTARRRR